MAMFNSYVKLPEGIYTINGNPLMVDISIVNGIINQLITWGAPPCRSNMVHTWYPHPPWSRREKSPCRASAARRRKSERPATPGSAWACGDFHTMGIFNWDLNDEYTYYYHIFIIVITYNYDLLYLYRSINWDLMRFNGDSMRLNGDSMGFL